MIEQAIGNLSGIFWIFLLVIPLLLIKKLHLVSWRGCPTFGVQFNLKFKVSDDLFIDSIHTWSNRTRSVGFVREICRLII